jgi:hypothetical protein
MKQAQQFNHIQNNVIPVVNMRTHSLDAPIGMKAEGEKDDTDNKTKEHERRICLVRVAARLHLMLCKYRAQLALKIEQATIEQVVVEEGVRIATVCTTQSNSSCDTACQRGDCDEAVNCQAEGNQERDSESGHAEGAGEDGKPTSEGVIGGRHGDAADFLTASQADGGRENNDAEDHLELTLEETAVKG